MLSLAASLPERYKPIPHPAKMESPEPEYGFRLLYPLADKIRDQPLEDYLS
jgi:hypothetical protein